MDVRVGDVLRMKKPHPCGSSEFTVLRVGMDFKIKCSGCGREVMLPRLKCEKNIKKILREEPGEQKLLSRRWEHTTFGKGKSCYV